MRVKDDLLTIDITKGWSTHMPVLIELFNKTDGPIMEAGSGVYSTPLLHWLCYATKRKLVTYENDASFIRLARQYEDSFHEVHLIDDYKSIPTTERFSFALIDHSGHERGKTAIHLKDMADYIVLHDSNVERKNMYDIVWPQFAYRKDYKEEIPWTTVVSDKIAL